MKMFIDTDPGVDDALALLMALADPKVELLGLGIAAGNVGLEHTVRNALKLLEVAAADVPVFAGCAAPLVRPAEDAAYVHGRDGFGDTGYRLPTRAAEAEHAAQAMLRLSRAHPGELTLVTLGPLTNLAVALSLDPTLPTRVPRLVVMGGAINGRGNTSVPAEFNIAFDPEAAHVVFSRWPHFELVDWEATLAHALPGPKVSRWLAQPSPRAAFYDAISRLTRAWSQPRYGEDWHSADALAMAVALAPEGVLAAEDRPVAIELDGGLTRGASVVDWLRRGGKPDNARLVQRYDQSRFETLIAAALGAR